MREPGTPLRDLEKAGALILAEIARRRRRGEAAGDALQTGEAA